MKIDIIVVNWNAGDQLRACLRSIARYGANLASQVIVVDNDSTDGSVDQLNDFNLPLAIIRNRANLGFGKACNLGARQASSDYLLFLNPDAALLRDTLSRTLAHMQDPANARVGICGVQLLDEAGKVARTSARFPSVLGFMVHATGLDRGFPRLGHFMAEWDHSQTRRVDQVIGAFFLVRRALFEELKGFDERFFVYFEEVDFSRRAYQVGWLTTYLADAQAFHAGGGTSNQVKARRLFYALRSRLLYAFKHFSWLGAVGVLLVTLLLEPLTRSVLAVFRRSWSGLKETWCGYGMLWWWLLERLRK